MASMYPDLLLLFHVIRPSADTLPGSCLAVGQARDSGAATKSRTRDLLITNQLLYQLSYSGTPPPWISPSGEEADSMPRSTISTATFFAFFNSARYRSAKEIFMSRIRHPISATTRPTFVLALLRSKP